MRAIEKLAGELGPEKLLVLQYHYRDSYSTTATEAKVKEYQIRGFPSVFFNGGNLVSGGSDKSYGMYLEVIKKELEKPSPTTIVVTAGTANNEPAITFKVTNISHADLQAVALKVVFYEDIGTNEHHYVVRDILQPLAIDLLPAGNTRVFNITSSTSRQAIKGVVFLQDVAQEVYQAAGFVLSTQNSEP